jgi:hypothetical protein
MAGETTVALSLDVPFELPAGQFLVPFSVAYSTTQNEAADVMELGYLPPCKVFGLHFVPSASMAASALVHKVTVGSTDVATGIIAGVLATPTYLPIIPQTLTAKTLAKVTTTTAATTPAAATLNVSFVCQK